MWAKRSLRESSQGLEQHLARILCGRDRSVVVRRKYTWNGRDRRSLVRAYPRWPSSVKGAHEMKDCI